MGMLLSQYKNNKSLLFIIKYISIKMMYGIGQRLFLLSDFAVNVCKDIPYKGGCDRDAAPN